MAQPRDSWLTKNGKARRVSLDNKKNSQNHNRLDQRRLVNDSGLLGLDNARRVSTDRPSLDHISEDLCSKTKGSDPPKTHNCSSTDTLQPSQDSKHDVFAHIDWQAFDEQCANLVNDQSHKKCKLQNSEQVYAKAISDQEGIVSEENVNHQHETPSTIATILNNRKEGSPMASTTRTDTNGVIDVQDQSTKVKSPDFEKETKDVDLSELLEPVILTQQVSNQTVGSQGQSIVQDNSRNSEKYKHRTAGKRQSADTQGIDINHQTQKQRKVATAPLQESYIRPVSPKEVNKIAEVNKTNTRNQLEKYPPLDPIDEEENHSRDEAYYSQSMFPSQEDYGGIVLAFTQEIKESNTKWLAEEKEKAKNEVTDEDEEEEYESFPNDLTQDELDARFHSFARRPAEDLLWKELDGLVSPSTGAREWVYDSHNLADPERKRIYKVGQTWSSMKDPDWAYTIQGCIEKGCLTKKLLCTASRRITTTIFQGKWENGKNIWLEDSEPVIIDMKKLNWGPDLGFTKPPIIFAENIIKTRKSGYGCSFVWKGQAEKIPLKEKPKVLELFAGAGGMSLGLEKAGFDVTVLVENDINAYQCLEANFPHKDVYKESVEIFLERSLNGDPGYPKQGSFQHLHASCPCQGVSKANRAKNGGKNGFDNNYKMYLFLEVVKLLKPLTISFENVTGLLDEPKCDFLREIIATLLHELNYHVRVCVLCAADYGDPQQRDRVFLFASKREIPLALEPVKTHDSNIQTVRESIGDLENINPQPGSGRVLLRNGKVIQNHTCEGTEKNNKGLEKLIPDKPAPTLYGNSTNTMLHYTHNRCLTTRELARLMSFPDSHKFPSKRNVARSLIYNAVPVHLATAVAKSIMDACYTRDYSHEDQSAVSKCKKPSK